MDLVLGIFLVSFAALVGGILSKALKLPPLVGYISAGVAVGIFFPGSLSSIKTLAQLGTILLLFSIGIELSFDSLSRFLKIAVFGALVQIVLVTLFVSWILNWSGFDILTSVVLAAGFSLSSTAVVVKILSDRGELETIHGEIMFGWLLVQDLAVIPIMVILPIFGSAVGSWGSMVVLSLIKAAVVISMAFLLGKLIFPKLLHIVAGINSREILLLLAFALALGTAYITSLVGISPALGAFLAGIVISESLERHAVFSEVRPLRDLFVALFFVSLGFLVTPQVLVSKLGLILVIAAIVLIIKLVVVFLVSSFFGYRGKVAIANSFGLSQVGEFAFVIFSTSLGLKLLSPENTSLGIAVSLLTLVVTPLLFNAVVPVWRFLRGVTQKYSMVNKLFLAGEPKSFIEGDLHDHIIICGYGRVGSWIGKVFEEYKIPFVVIDYNQKVVTDLKDRGVPVLYGDPTEPEVLELVGIRGSRAIILAIPDRVAQETLIAYVQTVAPNVKIIGRAHQDADWDRLRSLRVDKIVQPEFEAAVEIIRSVLTATGKPKEEISESIRRLRMSHSWIS